MTAADVKKQLLKPFHSEYPIKVGGKDFDFINSNLAQNLVGSRDKRVIIDRKTGEAALFKYVRSADKNTEDCSEKIAYELAILLRIPAARIELAKDENGSYGVLSYLFIDKAKGITHTDARNFLSVENGISLGREQFYQISHIKKKLDQYSEVLFADFARLLVFDALVGESDRHEENWGLLYKGGEYHFSPLYDTASCLLRECKDSRRLDKFGDGPNDISLDDYIRRSTTKFITENGLSKYKSFDLVNYLLKNYSGITIAALELVRTLQEKQINAIVSGIPKERMTDKHKQYIIKYILRRQEILTEFLRNE